MRTSIPEVVDLLPENRTELSMISYLRKGESMSRSNHTEAQMIGALKQLEAGRKAEDVAREVGVSKHTIYAWKAKYGGMDVSEAQEAKQLRDENTRLRKGHILNLGHGILPTTPVENALAFVRAGQGWSAGKANIGEEEENQQHRHSEEQQHG